MIPIEAIADIYNHRRVPLSKLERERKQGIYPYYGASGVIDFVDDFLFEGDFVLVSEDGENLKTRKTPIAFEAKGQFWVNNHAHILKGKKPFHNDLLVHAFANLDLTPYITGAVQPKLNKANLLSIELVLPLDEKEQEAIAEVLSSLDDKIDLLKRQNKTLEGMAEALFRQWFIEEAQDDWGNSSLEHLIQTTVGGEWGKESPQGDFVHKCLCMRGTDIADFASGDPQRIPERYLKESNVTKTRVTNGDLIIEISGGTDDQSTGRTFLYSNSARALFPCTLVFSNFCRLIRPRIPELGTFLHFFIKYLLEKKFLFNFENGTSGIKNLDYRVLLFFEKFRLPPEGRMIEFHDQYIPHLDKIIANRVEIINLQSLRDTLLPKLMSGEVRVNLD